MQEPEETSGVVFYTDGGARPNPGYTGWGAHGYTYTTAVPSQGSGLSKYRITPLGYCVGKTDATTVTPVFYYDAYGANPPDPLTNNAAELDAVINVLQFVAADLSACRRIHIATDSEYVRRGIETGLSIWEKRGWLLPDGRAVANQDRWKAIALLLAECAARAVHVTVAWVESHNNHIGNTLADLLATVGVQHAIAHKPQCSITATPAKGYWKPTEIRHPFLGHRRLYFNSNAEYNRSGAYFLVDTHGKDDNVGKKQPNAAYAMVRLTTPDVAIETVKAAQYALPDQLNTIMEMHLDVVHQPRVYAFLSTYGVYATLRASPQRLGLCFLDKQPLTIEKTPPKLCLRAIECSAILEQRLDTYLADLNAVAPNHGWASRQYHDITDTLYETKQKGRADISQCLRATYGVGAKDVVVSCTVTIQNSTHPLRLILALGSDLPDRNDLKRIETHHPRVLLMTWQESSDTIHYSVIIETTDAIGIWSNFYANQVFLPPRT